MQSYGDTNGRCIRERKMSTSFFCTDFVNTPHESGTSRQNSRDIPGALSRNPRKKLSREGMNFWTPTPSRGRPLFHPAISGPKKLILNCLRKPLTSTLLTSTFDFRSGGFPFRGFELERSLVAGPYPQYGWHFPEEIPEQFRKDPRNALRAFPGISVESTAGMPQTL